MKLKGHETFAIREGWLEKGLLAVQTDTHVFTKNQGADALGVGTNMAKSIRYWLKAGGWVCEQQRKGATLTKLGQLVFSQDPYIENPFTLWLFHATLVCNPELATSWYLIFQELEAEEFTREELFQMLKQRLLLLPDVTNIPERSLKDDVTVFLHMYTKQQAEASYDPEEKKLSPFAQLGLLRKSDATHYRRMQPKTDDALLAVTAYLIQQYVGQMKDREKGISIETLQKQPGLLGRVCNLNRVALNECLDRLAEKGLLLIHRTAGLDMVYPQTDVTPEQIAEAYYEQCKKKEQRGEKRG
ncbi:MAG: DUF4007 family protein [Lachnospiraceae bacterium]